MPEARKASRYVNGPAADACRGWQFRDNPKISPAFAALHGVLICLALRKGLVVLALAVMAVFVPADQIMAQADDEALSPFAQEIKELTGDWKVREGFSGDPYAQDGNLLLHPETLDAQRSPVNMRLFPEEPALGRTARAVLSHHFEPMTIEKQPVDFSTVQAINDSTIAVAHEWLEYNDNWYFGFWGVITTKQGTHVPFRLQCRRNYEYYGFEQCLQAGAQITSAVGVGALKVPEPQTPVAVSGFTTAYGNDGFVTLTKSNYNRTVNAIVRVSPAVTVDPEQMPVMLRNYSDTLLDQFDREKENPSALRFVGSVEEPWIRREIDGVYGARVLMAGLVRIPDGRHSVVTVDCPNPSWQESCAHGVEQAKLFITTGIAERRRVALVEKANVPLPTRGLATGDVAAVYSVGRTNGAQFYHDFAILLKDGRAYDESALPPQMIDISAPPGDSETRWGRWTRRSGGHAITWDDGESEVLLASETTSWVGGTRATRLSGYFGNVFVSNFGFNNGTVNRSGYTLRSDGSFQSSQSSSFSVSAFLPNGNAAPTQIASGASSNQSGVARYEVDGFMITFYYPDGQIERRSFAVPAAEAGNASPSEVMIGGTVLRRDFR